MIVMGVMTIIIHLTMKFKGKTSLTQEMGCFQLGQQYYQKIKLMLLNRKLQKKKLMNI